MHESLQLAKRTYSIAMLCICMMLSIVMIANSGTASAENLIAFAFTVTAYRKEITGDNRLGHLRKVAADVACALLA